MMRSFVLWLGMYCITVTLFWLESGSVATGAAFGLVSASLKTIWSISLNRLWGPKQ